MKTKIFLIYIVLSFGVSSSYSQWVEINTVPSSITLASLSVVSGDIVWLAGGPSNGTPVVWKSTNGGVNFVSAVGTGLLLDLFGIWAFDVNKAFAVDGGGPNGVGGNARLYKTTNGGLNWTTVLETGGNVGFFNGVVFSRANPLLGIAQSDPPTTNAEFYVRITTDGGTTWNTVLCPPVPGSISQWNSVVFIDELFFGFGLTNSTTVKTTSNGGTTWINQNLGLTGISPTGFAFANDKLTGVATSINSLPSVARTTNGGINWNVFNSGTGITGYGIVKWVWGTNVFYATGTTGSPGVIMRSTDNGVSWSTMSTPSIGNQILNMDFVKGQDNIIYGYACTQNGRVFKLQDNVIGINNNSEFISDYSLSQNYPNPFNPVTNINFELGQTSDVSLIVYNSAGEEIKNLVSEIQSKGQHEVRFNGEGLASGVYFYTLTARSLTDAHQYKETRRMLLLK